MSINPLRADFLVIWRRALELSTLNSLTPDLVRGWATDRGLAVEAVEERSISAYNPISIIVLTAGGQRACFPTTAATGDPLWEARHEAAERRAGLWKRMEWFYPLWVPMGQVQQLLNDVANAPENRAISIFNYRTSTIYTLAFQALCIAQFMPQARSLRDFCPLAREAYLAFYSGYKASSIAALIPAIEGTITRIASEEHADLAIPDKIERVFDRAFSTCARLHFESMWTPREYLTTDYLLGQSERAFAIETFRRWLQGSYFCRTDEYYGQTWLNRHLFAHGTSSSWQEAANFSRLIVALTTLGAVESWHDDTNQVPFYIPEMSEDSKLLHQQAVFRGASQHAVIQAETKYFHEHGRLIPPLPMDDGSLMRKAMLSEDCINDLVRPLRDAGWQVSVSDPEETGLYMTIVASSGEILLRAALLFSCATDNATYKMLAQSCTAILYRGPPYHQDQYAYGLGAVHVGPVAGWQPPSAPGRRQGTPAISEESSEGAN
jgi:hypothetical protein